MARVTEEIILKVGTDTSKATEQIAGLGKVSEKTEKDVDGLNDALGDMSLQSNKTSKGIDKTARSIKKTGSDIKKTELRVESFTHSIKRMTQQNKISASSFAGLGGVVTTAALAAAAAITALVTAQIKAQRETLIASKAIGINAQELSNMIGLGSKFGATSEDIIQGFKNIQEIASLAAADGQGAKFDAFKELGIDLQKFNTFGATKQMRTLGEAFNKVSNEGDRTRLRLEIMQEEGFKLSGTMEELAARGSAATDEIEDLTGSLSPEIVNELTESFADLKLSLAGFANAFIKEFGGDISIILKEMAENVKNVTFAFDDPVEVAKIVVLEEILGLERKIGNALEDTALVQNMLAESQARARAKRKRNAAEMVKEKEREAAALKKSNEKELSDIESLFDRASAKKKDRDAKEKASQDKKAKSDIERAKRVIGQIEDAKDRARIRELRALGGGTDITQIEAGSQEAAELLLRSQNTQPIQLAEADRLEKQLADKAAEQRRLQLNAAQRTVEVLEQIEQKEAVDVVAGGII